MSLASAAPRRPGNRNRDIRTGGTWSRWQSWKNEAIYRLIRLGAWFADALPRRWLRALGRAIGRTAGLLLHARRRDAERWLQAAGCDGRHSKRLASLCFVNAGANLAECWDLRRGTTRALERVRLDSASEAILRAALATKRGVVFVSAHLGPFEWIAAAIAEFGARPAVVVRESYDPRLDAIVDQHRLDRGVDVIHRGAPSAPLRIARALRQGRPVGFLPDIGGRVPSEPVEFLGRTVHFPVGPSRIARRFGATLVVGTLQGPKRGAWSLVVDAVPDGGTETELTQRVADTLATRIRNCPAQWLWMAPRV